MKFNKLIALVALVVTGSLFAMKGDIVLISTAKSFNTVKQKACFLTTSEQGIGRRLQAVKVTDKQGSPLVADADKARIVKAANIGTITAVDERGYSDPASLTYIGYITPGTLWCKCENDVVKGNPKLARVCKNSSSTNTVKLFKRIRGLGKSVRVIQRTKNAEAAPGESQDPNEVVYDENGNVITTDEDAGMEDDGLGDDRSKETQPE